MTNYEDDDIDDDIQDNEPAEGDEGGAAPSRNRNFIIGAGILGAILILLVIAVAVILLNRNPQTPVGQEDIPATNAVIETSNAGTAAAATQLAGLPLTPSVTPTATNTLVPPTVTNTQVLAKASPTNTAASSGAILTVTPNPNLQTRTATIVALLTQNAAQTQTKAAAVKLTGTATVLPKTGFAEDVGLPGLFGLALGLVLVIVLVRRLRLSPNG